MSTEFLLTPIEYLKGVGPQRGDLFKSELGIKTFQDLLNHFPFRYVDKTKFAKINEISSEEINIQLKARVTNVKEVGAGRAKRLVATVMDDTGSLDLVWFKGIKWIKPIFFKLITSFV